MLKNSILYLILGAGLTACSSYNIKNVKSNTIEVTNKDTNNNNNSIELLVKPYRDSLKLEMETIIGFAETSFFRKRPSGALGNFVADLSLNFVKENLVQDAKTPIIAVFNHGGLRNPISKGEITKADVFKLMPFDNTITVLKFKANAFNDILKYLKERGGEPIAGFRIENDRFIFNAYATYDKIPDYFYLVTSDYLANGGDNMVFMSEYIERKNTTFLLRDVIINHIKEVERINNKEYTDNRISLE